MRKKFPLIDQFVKKASVLRFMMNLWPVFRGSGIWIDYMKDDYSEMKVSLGLSFFNANIFGVHFGGSLYSMVDPFIVTLLTPRLGNKYYCWDYSGKIRYVKPGTGRVSAQITLSDETVKTIIEKANTGEKVLHSCEILVKDEGNHIVAIVTKTVYVRLKERFRT